MSKSDAVEAVTAGAAATGPVPAQRPHRNHHQAGPKVSSAGLDEVDGVPQDPTPASATAIGPPDRSGGDKATAAAETDAATEVEPGPRSIDQIRAEVAARRLHRRGAADWPPELMADLWRLPEAAPYLAQNDVKAIYTFLRWANFSQRQLARMVKQSQSEISEVMAGRRVQSITLLARIASGLSLPPGTFGLTSSTPDERGRRTTNDAVPPPSSTDNSGTWPEHRCSSCLCSPPAAPLIDGHFGVPLVPLYWTGVELYGLRLCVGMSVGQFAAAIGVTTRQVADWEAAGADQIPRPETQAAAERLLIRALPLEQARFAGWLVHGLGEPPYSDGDREKLLTCRPPQM